MHNGLWAIAIDVTNEKDYRELYDEYEKKEWLHLDLFRLKKGELWDYLEGRRVGLLKYKELLEGNKEES